MRKPTKPAVYLRCSSKSQDTDAQRAAIQRYLDGQSLEIGMGMWFEDQAVSGKTMQRPGLTLLNDAIFNGEVDCVVFYSVDRFARTMIDGLNELDRWQKAGVVIVFVSQGLEIDPTEWSGQVVMKILVAITLAFAEQERERISSRRRAGIEFAKEQTEKVKELHRKHPGMTAREIAAKVDLEQKHVQYVLNHPRATLYWGGKKKGDLIKKTFTLEKIQELTRRGFRPAEIQRYFGVAKRTYYKRLEELGGADAFKASVAAEKDQQEHADLSALLS